MGVLQVQYPTSATTKSSLCVAQVVVLLASIRSLKKRLVEAHLPGRLADSDFTEYYESLQTDLALAKSELSLAEAQTSTPTYR
jgi:hypothetical protein